MQQTVTTTFPNKFGLWWGFNDTETDMLHDRKVMKRHLRSRIWWFTESCNSHYVSHLAALFIVAGTKISVAESCFRLGLRWKSAAALNKEKQAAQVQIWFRLFKTVVFGIHHEKTSTVRRGKWIWIHPVPAPCEGRAWEVLMILPQVHLRKPCYDFSFL